MFKSKFKLWKKENRAQNQSDVRPEDGVSVTSIGPLQTDDFTVRPPRIFSPHLNHRTDDDYSTIDDRPDPPPRDDPFPRQNDGLFHRQTNVFGPQQSDRTTAPQTNRSVPKPAVSKPVPRKPQTPAFPKPPKPVLPKSIVNKNTNMQRSNPRSTAATEKTTLNNEENPAEEDSTKDAHYGQIKEALQNDQPELAIKKTKEILEDVTLLPLAIAITGESGSGKSSLVNALRGVEQSDPRAAPTDVVETTMVPTAYTHPLFPSVTVWDLPGIGTTNMTAAKYLEYVEFHKYDFFIIVSHTRFRENDANLAREIKRMKKNFYFVRSKIDQDMYSAQKTQRVFSKEETFIKIRNNCVKELQKLGFTSPKVFLLSSLERLQYDFSLLVMTLESELSANQRESLLRAVPSYSLEIIERKKVLLAEKIPKLVAGAVFGGVLPYTSIGINQIIIKRFARDCLMTFGLTEETLELLSRESGVPVAELKAVMKLSLSPDVGIVIGQVFNGLLSLYSVQMIVSGMIVHSNLHRILEITAEDTHNVLKKALGLD